MKLLTPTIFQSFSEVVAAMSLRDEDSPGQLSMVDKGTDIETAKANRKQFCDELGFKSNRLTLLKQIHSDNVHVANEHYTPKEGDALIATEPGWLLGVTVADCVPVLIYEPKTGCYGAIHSGWRGSAQNITGATITKVVDTYKANPKNIYAWIGPAAGPASYTVGFEVVSQFNQIYSQPQTDDSWLFDNKSVVRDQLLNSGLEEDHIEISGLDTITNHELHSARRDGDESGRMCAAIGILR